MSDRPKPKPASSKGRNPDRRNGKAFKKSTGQGSHTRGAQIPEVMKCNLGHGVLDRYRRPMTQDEADVYFVTRMQRAS